MSAHAARLARLFTPEYARRINKQIVHPASSHVVKPNELESWLARPILTSMYEPDRPPAYFAAALSYGLITGACCNESDELDEGSDIDTRTQGIHSWMGTSGLVRHDAVAKEQMI